MIYMEEIKKEPVTVGLILINIIVFLAVNITDCLPVCSCISESNTF